MGSTVKLSPFQFAHIQDLNKNVTRVIQGPCTYVVRCNERVEGGPFPHVIIPPGHFCMIKNPARTVEKGVPLAHRHGEFDVRFHGEPFVLYPGEELCKAPHFTQPGQANNTDYKPGVAPLPIVPAHHGIRLQARVDFLQDGKQFRTGDQWQIQGPLTYRPEPLVEVVDFIEPCVIKPNQALRLQAIENCVDKYGNKRVSGEEWLITEEGAYLPNVKEKVIKVEKAKKLTDKIAVHLEATENVTFMGTERKAGDVWLVTSEHTDTLIAPIGVKIVKQVVRTVLSDNQYVFIQNPVDESGVPQLGKREVRRGPCSFFLNPGEEIPEGHQFAKVLSDREGLVLRAMQAFVDKSQAKAVTREPGELWMICGPASYIPTVEVEIVRKHDAIPLKKNEGVYVRNIRSGHVRAVMGPKAYLLDEHEELWRKQLSPLVESLLQKGGGQGSDDIRKIAYFEQSIDPAILNGRDKTRVVSYRCPGNTACQVYNYQERTARVVFGPDLVLLAPHESFNVLSLSAGKPKKPDAMQSLALMLGPDFITDVIEVETSDHARLTIRLAFNNHFEYDPTDLESSAKLFSVPDFIGFASSQIAGRIRAEVARVTFDEFHRNSAAIVKYAAFLNRSTGKQDEYLKFDANNLVISSIDVQSIEPSDARMRDSLMKSVQMAIEISTNSIEAAASHEAAATEQKARGMLERQKLTNAQDAEREMARLLELRSITAAVESTGQAVAEAKAQAEKSSIEGHSEIEAARLKAEAEDIEFAAHIETQNKMREAELEFQREQTRLEILKKKQMASLEVGKFQRIVNAMGRQTLSAIATAGPDAQVKLLQGLGLKSVLLTDGKSPVNLFNTAQGLVGGATQ